MSNDSLHPFQSEAHYRLLRAKLLAFLDRRSCTAADEVADEALTRLIVLAKARTISNVDATAFAIAKNVFHEWLRHAGRFVAFDAEPNPDSTPGSQRFRQIAEAVVCGLDPIERDFLEQYFIDGKKAQELAAQLGISPVAVRGRTYRLRQQLRALVNQMLSEAAPVPVFTPLSMS